jgi:uncharacterized Tic20 family protein
MTQGDPIPPPPATDPVPPPPAPPPGAAPTMPMTVTPAPWPPGQVESNPEARQWGMFAHLAALAGFIIPLGHVIGPLVVWLTKKEQLPFVNDQGKEALNFQITISIGIIAGFVIGAVTICIGGIGFLLVPAIGIVGAVFAAIGAMEANKGVAYRYPFALRLIK